MCVWCDLENKNKLGFSDLLHMSAAYPISHLVIRIPIVYTLYENEKEGGVVC
jgi:hypothetical protein